MDDEEKSVECEGQNLSEAERRRQFLKNCAKFASTATPAVAVLLSASEAQARHRPWHSVAFICSLFPFLDICDDDDDDDDFQDASGEEIFFEDSEGFYQQ